MHHIAIRDHIFLAFHSELAYFLGLGLATAGDEILIGDDFRANETAFEIGMNDGRRAGRSGALADGPGAHFLDAGGEITSQAEQVIAGADHAIEAGFVEA